MASEQDIRLAQGALFVIDNTGPCPDGKKYRTFIDAAIAHHLTRHTYYYQDRGRPGAKNTRRATARKFRNSLQALWEYVKPESRGRKGGDRAEALFTLKSEAITAEALQIYAYDPRTFSETDLPGFVDEGGDILQSREQTQTASTPAPEAQQVQASVLPPKRKLESLDEPQQHAAKRPRTEEPIADTDGNNRPFHISRSSQELASTSLMRAEEGSQSLDETQLRAAKRPRSGTPGDPTADAERDDLSSRMSRCRSCIQSKKGCDRQRPCGRCKAAGIGREGCIGEEVPGRGENQIATEKNGAASTSDVENNHSPPRSPRMPLPGPSTGSKRGLESSDEQQQNVAKRPRVDAADTPTRRKMLTIKLPRCKRCQQAHIGGCDGNMATVANETLQSDSLEATQSHDADSPYQEPQGHKIDLGMFVKQVKELQYGVEQAAHDLLACIGQIHNMPCPLDMEPSKDLEALYVRCWGAEWKAVATGLLKVGAFGNPFNTMSLISAFLFDKILNKQAYNKELAQDFIAQLQAGGPTGGAILKALDWSQRGKCTLHHGTDRKTDDLQSSRLLRPSPLSRLKKHEPRWPKMKPLFAPSSKKKQRL